MFCVIWQEAPWDFDGAAGMDRALPGMVTADVQQRTSIV
jgi:hypothetical protein